MATKLFCDSNCELTYNEIEELGITGIEMPYILEGKEYSYDFGKETNFKEFYDKMRNGATPTTSALNEYLYTEIFRPVFQAGDDIFYISFSSQLSATFNFMQSAVDKLLEEFPERKFTRFDTFGISCDAGLQVYYASKYFNEGHSVEETVKYLEFLREKTATYFSVDDLHHLKRGGRVSSVAATIGTMLNLKPMLWIDEDGKLAPLDKVKGTKKVYSYYADKIKELTSAETLEKYDIWVMHGDSVKMAEEVKSRILENFPNAKVRIGNIGPVIGAHCGAGVLAVSFVRK